METFIVPSVTLNLLHIRLHLCADMIKPRSYLLYIRAYSAENETHLRVHGSIFPGKLISRPEKVETVLPVLRKLTSIPCTTYLTERRSQRTLPNKPRVIAFPSRALSSSLSPSLSLTLLRSLSLPLSPCLSLSLRRVLCNLFECA